MSKPIDVPARPGPSHTPILISADAAVRSQPVSPCSARSEASWSQSRSRGWARGRRRERINDPPLLLRVIRRECRTSFSAYPHIMINHRDRLLLIPQIDTDHRAITRQQPSQPLPPRIPPPVTPRHVATLTHRTSSSLRMGHQARTLAPGGRPRINHNPARQPPLARRPIRVAPERRPSPRKDRRPARSWQVIECRDYQQRPD